MPDEANYHTVITPRVPIYAYSYGRKGNGFEIFCDPIVAFAFYYMDGMNLNVPLIMGRETLEDPSTGDYFLGISTDPQMTLEDWKEEILDREDLLELQRERLGEREKARQKGSGENLQP